MNEAKRSAAEAFRPRWKQIKAMQPPRKRYFHKTCEVAMLPDPKEALLGIELPKVPWVGRCTTYNEGRNADKRANREADIKRRALARRAA